MFDRIFSLLLIVLGVTLYWHSGGMTTELSSGNVGPEVLPRLLALILVIAASFNLTIALRVKAAKARAVGDDPGNEYRKFLLLVGLLVAYSLLLEPLGYVISTFLFLLGSFQTMQRGQVVKSAMIAAAFSGGVYLLYVKVALGSLPPLPFPD
jgi:putative tricarboxylic transport membrane protein